MVSWPVILFQSHKFGAKYLFFDFLVFLHCKSVGFPLKGSLKVSRLVCRQACEVLSVVEKQIRCAKSCDGNGNLAKCETRIHGPPATTPLHIEGWPLAEGWRENGKTTLLRFQRPYFWQNAPRHPHGAGRVCICRRSGRLRLHRKSVAAGQQRHWLFAVRIRFERKMAGPAQGNRAGRDPSGSPSESHGNGRDRSICHYPVRGPVGRGRC